MVSETVPALVTLSGSGCVSATEVLEGRTAKRIVVKNSTYRGCSSSARSWVWEAARVLEGAGAGSRCTGMPLDMESMLAVTWTLALEASFDSRSRTLFQTSPRKDLIVRIWISRV
jgi:hypothetical protein